MNKIPFDIETGKNSDYEKFMPDFNLSFDPSSVKYGNTKDPVKRAAKLEESEAAFYEAQRKEKEKWLEGLALNAMTGRVICIKYWVPESLTGNLNILVSGYHRDELDERLMLERFWTIFCASRPDASYMVGWNCYSFDLKFLYQRSLMLGIKVPINPLDRHWYKQMCIDLMEVWSSYQYRDFTSLKNCALALGFESKYLDSANYEAKLKSEREKTLEDDKQEMELLNKVAGVLLP